MIDLLSETATLRSREMRQAIFDAEMGKATISAPLAEGMHDGEIRQ
ncbi:hypothetical protein [Bradyrhizobium monzae]|nr:hypothetical protein [Bradyrhizobium sp. Oc8]